ncbi:MAG: ribosome rescue protein RqcH [Candidatus Thermoplasmatota archaeon]|jgi:predicted ribosome quality control (RQC) complex YloA/Tae2 family protein|nr:ribosome rescue protein RqcH [Candidatus Thermoplasmatota archaeon]
MVIIELYSEDIIMDYSLTSFDIAVLEKEFQVLKGAYFDKAFMLETGEIVIRFTVKKDNVDSSFHRVLPELSLQIAKEARSSSKETEESGSTELILDENCKEIKLEGERSSGGNYYKVNLFIGPGRLLFCTHKSFIYPMIPHSFAMLLRKYLRNRRLLRIYQHRFDRVLTIEFGHVDDHHKLILEMFKEGNVILVKDEGIIQPLFSRSYSARTIRARHDYLFPPERYNPKGKEPSRFIDVMETTELDAVRCLAMELNLGGAMAEEVLKRSVIDKNRTVKSLSQEEMKSIADIIHKLLEETLQAGDSFAYKKAGEIRKISRFPLEGIAGDKEWELEKFPSLNGILEKIALSKGDYEEAEVDGADGIDGSTHDPKVAKVLRKITQQEKGIKKFEAEIERNSELADLVYLNYQRLEGIIKALREAQMKFGWKEVRKRIKNIPDISSIDQSTWRAGVLLPHSDGVKREVSIEVKKDVNENAAAYFEKAKKSRAKMKGAKLALETSYVELEKAKKKAEKRVAETEKISQVKKSTKKNWFESYRWFISSDSNVVIGGKDAKTNEKIVKKYLDKGARYIHTDVHGSPSVVVLPHSDGEEISGRTLKEGGIFSACFSRSWARQVGSQTAYWVNPDQVSKSPQSGEFLPKGSFIVRGKRNWMAKLEMRIAVGRVRIDGDEKYMSGPISALEVHSDEYVIIVPGEIEKNTLAKRLSKIFNESTDLFLSMLPPGGGQITGSYGIDESLIKD